MEEKKKKLEKEGLKTLAETKNQERVAMEEKRKILEKEEKKKLKR